MGEKNSTFPGPHDEKFSYLFSISKMLTGRPEYPGFQSSISAFCTVQCTGRQLAILKLFACTRVSFYMRTKSTALAGKYSPWGADSEAPNVHSHHYYKVLEYLYAIRDR